MVHGGVIGGTPCRQSRKFLHSVEMRDACQARYVFLFFWCNQVPSLLHPSLQSAIIQAGSNIRWVLPRYARRNLTHILQAPSAKAQGNRVQRTFLDA